MPPIDEDSQRYFFNNPRRYDSDEENDAQQQQNSRPPSVILSPRRSPTFLDAGTLVTTVAVPSSPLKHSLLTAGEGGSSK